MKNYETMYFIVREGDFFRRRIYKSRINKIISMIMYKINDSKVVQVITKNNAIGVSCNYDHPFSTKYYYYEKWRNYEI